MTSFRSLSLALVPVIAAILVTAPAHARGGHGGASLSKSAAMTSSVGATTGPTVRDHRGEPPSRPAPTNPPSWAGKHPNRCSSSPSCIPAGNIRDHRS